MSKGPSEDLLDVLQQSQKLYSTLDAKEVLATAYQLAEGLFRADAVVISLKESGLRLRVVAYLPRVMSPAGSSSAPPEKGRGGSPNLAVERWIEGESVARLRVPDHPVVLTDAPLEEWFRHLQVSWDQPREALIAPLEVEGHPLGFLVMGRSAGGSWPEGDLPRAALFGRALAQALENSRFHRQLATFSDESLAVAYEKLKAAYDELQQMQSQLLNTEKLNVVGKLASSVAHQLRNPLGVIKASAQLLLNKVKPVEGALPEDYLKWLKPNGLLQDRLNAIHRNAVHADTIITELLQAARPQPTEPLQPVAVHEILDEAVKMMESKFLDCGVTLKKEYGVLPQVMASAHHLQQVFLNFVMNSLEAMPNKGSIRIASRLEGKRLTLTFEDTGEGFTPEALEKIAQPFFTTKPHGVGLGMYTAQKILEAHGGYLDVKSQNGKGTTITVTLPLAGEKTAK